MLFISRLSRLNRIEIRPPAIRFTDSCRLAKPDIDNTAGPPPRTSANLLCCRYFNLTDPTNSPLRENGDHDSQWQAHYHGANPLILLDVFFANAPGHRSSVGKDSFLFDRPPMVR